MLFATYRLYSNVKKSSSVVPLSLCLLPDKLNRNSGKRKEKTNTDTPNQRLALDLTLKQTLDSFNCQNHLTFDKS